MLLWINQFNNSTISKIELKILSVTELLYNTAVLRVYAITSTHSH